MKLGIKTILFRKTDFFVTSIIEKSVESDPVTHIASIVTLLCSENIADPQFGKSYILLSQSFYSSA